MTKPSLQALSAQYGNQDALTVQAAQNILEHFIEPIAEMETIALKDALGRVIAEDIVSPINVPPHDNSAMDGFAFHSSVLENDIAITLSVMGTRLAGHTEQISLGSRECLRIMTGASMPLDCDTVVPQEWSELVRDDEGRITHVRFESKKLKAGDNRRRAGEDLALGQTIVSRGTRLQAADMGLLASVGIAHIRSFRPLRIAYFSTGDELRSIGEPLDAGCIYDSNRYTLCSLLRAMDVEVIDLGVIRDHPQNLKETLTQACQTADAIITSGGVSMGAADFTKQVMQEMGEVAFWSLEMRPGRPMAVGRIVSNSRQAYLFGLPGNPVAAMLNFLFLTRPALQRLQGQTPKVPSLLPAIAAHNIRKRPGRTEYQRCLVQLDAQGRLIATTTGAQGSGILRSMVEADAILVLDEACGDVAAGDLVYLHLLHGLFSNA